jgi:hypothetical protein
MKVFSELCMKTKIGQQDITDAAIDCGTEAILWPRGWFPGSDLEDINPD